MNNLNMAKIQLNGNSYEINKGSNLNELLDKLKIKKNKVAIEVNGMIIEKNKYLKLVLNKDDKVEIVHFIGGGWNFMEDLFTIANKNFKSRLIVGTGKYKDFEETAKAVKASAADMVTVAVRRVNILNKNEPLLTDYLDPKTITYLPNTAGCYTSEDALRTLRLAREMGGWRLVKLEVLGDKKTLYPNMIETLKSTETLVKEGFDVMVYCTDDPILSKKLEDVGACAIMPLAAPIGSGIGIQNKTNITLIKEQSSVPVIVDAGVGTASDATIAMELGCDGVLVNTAIAEAKNPVLMAEAMRHAVLAGRKAYKAERMKKRKYASASSPKDNLI